MSPDGDAVVAATEHARAVLPVAWQRAENLAVVIAAWAYGARMSSAGRVVIDAQAYAEAAVEAMVTPDGAIASVAQMVWATAVVKTAVSSGASAARRRRGGRR